MLLVGLTGGIGSGKSTVARLLERHGAVLIDADALAREAIGEGRPGFDRVVDAFGPGYSRPTGPGSRPARPWSSRIRRGRPSSSRSCIRRSRRFVELVEAHRETTGVVVYVTPLLVELGLAPAFDVVVVVTASPTSGCRAWRRTEGSRPRTSERGWRRRPPTSSGPRSRTS